MTEEEWFEFVTLGKPPIVSVGRLDLALCAIIEADTSLIQMQHDYALKSLAKHKVMPHHFRIISWTVANGICFQDKPNELTFFWRDEYAGWFHVSIKTKRGGTELWLATFHRTTQRNIKKKLKNATILRTLKS
jgi:hypothetical protein